MKLFRNEIPIIEEVSLFLVALLLGIVILPFAPQTAEIVLIVSISAIGIYAAIWKQ